MRAFITVLCLSVASAIDDNTMLQVEVEASQEVNFAIQNINQQITGLDIPGKANKLAINAMMKTVANSQKLDDNAKEILRNVSAMLADPILTGLVAEKNLKQDALDTITSDVAFCNTNGVTENDQLASDVVDTRSNHSSCRDAQQSVYTDEKAICDEAIELMTGAIGELHCNFPPPANTDAAITAYTNQLNLLKTKFLGWLGEDDLKSDIEECIDETARLNNKINECTGSQNNHEVKFCEYRLGLTTMCSTRSSCHANATTAHNTRWSELGSLSATRVKEACLIKHVICLIDKLVEEESTDLTACDNVGLDSTTCEAEYGNVEPSIPAMDDCDTSVVDVYPGHGSWYAQEYSAMPANAQAGHNLVPPCA